MKADFLRKRYPRFIYKGYFYRLSQGNLKIWFDFQILPDIRFRPEIVIKNIPQNLSISNIDPFKNLIFHLGLIEIPSYWKTTCSPEIMIEAGVLNKGQIKWWKDLIINGLGQFFYENKIDWRKPSFLTISSCPGKAKASFWVRLKNRYLVPVGGGRDSILSLELLKKKKKEIGCFLVNPTPAAKRVVKVAGIENPIVIQRKIDPVLLKLNETGFLNGHTPFTAMLSFLSILCGVLFNFRNIAFSNEKSADEGNLKYLGKTINHQYSKSSEFETKFKNYCGKYLVKGVNYFSLLRPYTELEISRMFTKYSQYFPVFSSCNRASKIGKRWCGNCPKCLFTYMVLYPYLDKKQLLKIFGKDMFENRKLLPIMEGLIGKNKTKPFECVGTYRENHQALKLSLRKAKKEKKAPYLLKKSKSML